MVDVTFLGTGNAFSAGRRTNVALLISSAEFRMLVETSPMILGQLDRAGLRARDIERVFVTHAHGDHILGFPMLALSRLDTAAPLHVYAGLSTIASLRILNTLAFCGITADDASFRWHALSEEETDQVDLTSRITLQTVLPDHPPGTPTLAARWSFADGPSITFVTDTRPSHTTVDLPRSSDLLIHEASFSATLQPDEDPHEHYHSTARQAGQIAREAGCRQLALVHLAPKIGARPEVLIEEACAGTDLHVVVPEDGDQLALAR